MSNSTTLRTTDGQLARAHGRAVRLRAGANCLRSGGYGSHGAGVSISLADALEDERLNAIADERAGGPFVQVSLDDL